MDDICINKTRILGRLHDVAEEVCDRCYRGHYPFANEDGSWSHGVDETDEGSNNWIAPEPCPAGPIWELIEEIEKDHHEKETSDE